MNNSALNTGLILVVATAIIGLMVWSVQRIVGRIDLIRDQLGSLSTRVSVIESKQDLQVTTAAVTAKVARKTAAKVGVRLPRDLEQTIDPDRQVAP